MDISITEKASKRRQKTTHYRFKLNLVKEDKVDNEIVMILSDQIQDMKACLILDKAEAEKLLKDLKLIFP